ncbi:MAG: flagellar hook-associated protein FlgL [Deltaproteobacteria bacterium]|nr:flagellar hook-associated protein FlgL [Deltaproteobacteria bacterium]
MRVANKTLYDGIVRNLDKVSREMLDAQKVVSSGKNINSLSDDPVGLVTVLGLRASISNIEQLDKNISLGQSWLMTCESALGQINNIMSAAKERCVQFSNASVSVADRANAASIVDGYLEQIITLANTQIGGRYVFSGTNTDIMPYELNNAETQVDYYGTRTPFSIKIGSDTNMAVGRDGQGIFGENQDNDNIFKTFIDLKTSLQTNDISGIAGTLDKLESQMGTLNSNVSDISAKNLSLNTKKSIIQGLELSYIGRKSEIEDADLAEAIMNLSAKELAYNAALSASAKIMQRSLVDFL